MTCQTVQIKPTSPEQGEYIVINESDFDPKKHTLYTARMPRSLAHDQDGGGNTHINKRGAKCQA